MIDFDNLSTGDWIAIYENLNDDGHLSEEGKEQLRYMKGKRK